MIDLRTIVSAYFGDLHVGENPDSGPQKLSRPGQARIENDNRSPGFVATLLKINVRMMVEGHQESASSSTALGWKLMLLRLKCLHQHRKQCSQQICK